MKAHIHFVMLRRDHVENVHTLMKVTYFHWVITLRYGFANCI